MLLFVSMMILNTVTVALEVIGGSTTVLQGGTAVLPCKLIGTRERLNQISWQRMTKGKPQGDNFYTILETGPNFVNGIDRRFKFIGNFSDNNGTLSLSGVRMIDDGTYTCIFTLFPSGNHKTEIPLIVHVSPVTSLKVSNPTVGNEEVLLATCTAAASKPPAEVRWLTGTLGEKVRTTTNSILNTDGTTTTVSSLFGVPTREISHHLVQCVITSDGLMEEETLPLTIQIHFPPSEVSIHEGTGGSFECLTEANPSADITWTRVNQTWPQSGVSVNGATLQFLSMTTDLNGLYLCEASNLYGKKQTHLYVHHSSGTCTVCWTLFGLVVFLNAAAAAAVVYFLRYKRSSFNGPECLRAELEHVGEEKNNEALLHT